MGTALKGSVCLTARAKRAVKVSHAAEALKDFVLQGRGFLFFFTAESPSGTLRLRFTIRLIVILRVVYCRVPSRETLRGNGTPIGIRYLLLAGFTGF